MDYDYSARVQVTIGYYVTMVRGHRVAYLAGPYEAKDAAERAVDSVARMARKLDPWADFDAFGVTRLQPPVRLGWFNHMVRNDFAGRLQRDPPGFKPGRV